MNPQAACGWGVCVFSPFFAMKFIVSFVSKKKLKKSKWA